MERFGSMAMANIDNYGVRTMATTSTTKKKKCNSKWQMPY
jgi:hypothetical protein